MATVLRRVFLQSSARPLRYSRRFLCWFALHAPSLARSRQSCDTLGYMRHDSGSVQRSFRLGRRTADLLDAAAAAGTESRNTLVDRLLGEAVRLERHPLIRFHQGAGGRRQPLVVGTRLTVHQVMSTLRAGGNEIDEAATYFGVAPRLVRAALDYSPGSSPMKLTRTRRLPPVWSGTSEPVGNISSARWRETCARSSVLAGDRLAASGARS